MIDEDELPLDDEPDEPLPSEQPTVDAGSPRALRKRKLTQKIIDRERTEFWRAVLASPIGRREMWGILQAGHCFDERFACGPNGFPQPEATWFHAGEQAFVQRLYQSWSQVDRAGVLLMHDENDLRFARAKGAK